MTALNRQRAKLGEYGDNVNDNEEPEVDPDVEPETDPEIDDDEPEEPEATA